MSKATEDRLDQRGSWGNWMEYLFAFLGSLIGYGNVWRFPYVCFRNGGGAFLIPFFIAMFICGVPLMFLETIYSQYSNYGPGRVWEVCPLFKGIGLCMMSMVCIVSIYYTMIMAWTLYYLANSFSTSLPWTSCDNDWNTPNCTVFVNVTSQYMANDSFIDSSNITNSKVSSVEEYWFNNALSISSGIDSPGIMRWELVLCLLVAWTVTLLCLVKGIHSLGKVAYVAATLPYVILTVFLIRGCLLPGFDKGIHYFLVPRWELLGEFTVWRDAATQVFFSVGIGFGTVITLSSYNKFHNNCMKDAIIMPLLDSFTSIYAGLVIFGYLGYTAHLTNKDVDQVVAQGPGLVFIAYPAVISTLPLPQLWSVLFFLMLFSMGLDSQFVHVETITTAMLDCFPHLLPKKLLVTFMTCVGGFLLGLPLTTEAGVYILNLMDWYLASVALLMISILEVLALSWIYGVDELYSNVEQMIGYRPNIIFKYAWKFITPLFSTVLWLSGFLYFEPISTNLKGYNDASDAVGLVIAIVPILTVPIVAVRELNKRQGNLSTKIKASLRPSPLWQPAIYKEMKPNIIVTNDVNEEDGNYV